MCYLQLLLCEKKIYPGKCLLYISFVKWMEETENFSLFYRFFHKYSQWKFFQVILKFSSSFSLTSAASNERLWDQHIVAAGCSSDVTGGNDFVVWDNEEGRKEGLQS